MINLILEGETQPAAGNSWWIYIVLIGLIIVMLVIPTFTNRKRAKEYNQMIEGVRVGDLVRTVGGIIGRITKINEKDGYKTIIVETGAKGAKSTMEFDIASIYTVLSGSKAAEKNEELKAEEKPADDAEKPVEEKQQEPAEKTAKKVKKTSKK